MGFQGGSHNVHSNPCPGFPVYGPSIIATTPTPPEMGGLSHPYKWIMAGLWHWVAHFIITTPVLSSLHPYVCWLYHVISSCIYLYIYLYIYTVYQYHYISPCYPYPHSPNWLTGALKKSEKDKRRGDLASWLQSLGEGAGPRWGIRYVHIRYTCNILNIYI